MEEYIDILDSNGEPKGETKPKNIVHKEGLYHNTVHLWFYTTKGEILLAQRSYKKAICPGLWDVSVAGHVDAGESLHYAAIRETSEEIGLTISEKDLQKIGVFKCFQDYDFGISDYEFHNTYLVELKVELNHLMPQPDEVEALKLISLQEFDRLIVNCGKDSHLVASNKAYYRKVLSAIEIKLSNL